MPRQVGIRAWLTLFTASLANFLVATVQFGLAAASPILRDNIGFFNRTGLSTVELSYILAAPAAGLMLGTYIWGKLADRFGERRVLSSGMFFVAISSFLFYPAYSSGNGELFGLCALFFGVFGGAAYSGGGRAIVHAFPKKMHGTVLSLRHTSVPAGAAFGGLFVPTILRSEKPLLLFSSITFAALVCTLFVIVVIRKSISVDKSASNNRSVAKFIPYKNPSIISISLSSALLAFVQLAVGSFFTIYLVDEIGWSVALAVLIFSIVQLSGGVFRISLGVLSDLVKSRISVLRMLAILVLIFTLATVFSPAAIMAVVALSIVLTLSTAWHGVAVAAISDISPTHATGTSLGFQTTMNAFACAIAPPIFGWVLHSSSWNMSFMMCAMFAGASAMLMSNVKAHKI